MKTSLFARLASHPDQPSGHHDGSNIPWTAVVSVLNSLTTVGVWQAVTAFALALDRETI